MSEHYSAPYTLEYGYRRTTGPVMGRFLTSLRDGKIEGVKTASGKVVVPPVEWDPETGEPVSEWVEVGQTGVVTSYTWVEQPREAHPLKKPFAYALIQLDGADTSMLHVVEAKSPKMMRTGMRVKVRWAPRTVGSIRDIECFESAEPIGVIKTPVHIDFNVRPGKFYSIYLKALSEGRFVGGRDPESGKVYVPPRGASPTSGQPTEEILDVADSGTLCSFAIIRIPFEGQKLTPPYVFGSILLDGSDIPIYHLVSGLPLEEIRMGMRVKAKWKPKEEGGPTLESVLYFEPTGEPDVPFEQFKEHL